MKIPWEKWFKRKKDLFQSQFQRLHDEVATGFWACAKTEYGHVKYVAEEAKMPGTRHSLQDHTSSTYFLQLGPHLWNILSLS